MITRDQAALCASFMLDEDEQDPWEMTLPFPVAAALAHYDDRRSLFALMILQDQLNVWLVRDRAACIGLLGPGIGVDQ